jgi:LmbE family N-acetylglucosaminyl deacetylase
MPLTDRDRLMDDRLHSRVVDLWFALRALTSVASFMQSGAHPDDETSAMMAALRFRDGLSTSYVCSTRGEGGQNDIGPETARDLGTIRTAEMERAAAALDMRLWWLSETTPSGWSHPEGRSVVRVECLAARRELAALAAERSAGQEGPR